MRKPNLLISATALALTLLLMQPAVAKMQDPTGVPDSICRDWHGYTSCVTGAFATKLRNDSAADVKLQSCLLAAGQDKAKQEVCKADNAREKQKNQDAYDAEKRGCDTKYPTIVCAEGYRCSEAGTKCEPIPEPATVLLVIGGFAVAGRYLRRRASR